MIKLLLLLIYLYSAKLMLEEIYINKILTVLKLFFFNKNSTVFLFISFFPLKKIGMSEITDLIDLLQYQI